MIEAPQLLALQFTLSLLGYAALGFWFVRPWLQTKPRATALAILVVPQTFRFIGVTLLVPGVVGPGLPEAFARHTAIGDIIITVLAWLSLISLRAGWRFAIPRSGCSTSWGWVTCFSVSVTEFACRWRLSLAPRGSVLPSSCRACLSFTFSSSSFSCGVRRVLSNVFVGPERGERVSQLD